jgi:Flp pilus assembly protein TadD
MEDIRAVFEQQLAKLNGPLDGSLYMRDQRAISLNGLVWFFLTRAGAAAIDAQACIRLAEQSVELVPTTRSYWNTLGVAYYRAGQWDKAIVALERATALRSGHGYDWFPLAVAHAGRGDLVEARTWYDRGVQWMEAEPARLNNDDLKQLRAEAANLLELSSFPSRTSP